MYTMYFDPSTPTHKRIEVLRLEVRALQSCLRDELAPELREEIKDRIHDNELHLECLVDPSKL